MDTVVNMNARLHVRWSMGNHKGGGTNNTNNTSASDNKGKDNTAANVHVRTIFLSGT